MKSPLGNLAIVLAALVLVMSGPQMAFAKGLGGGGGKKPGTPAPVAHHTTIQMIDATSITIKEPKGSRTLAVTRFTQFTFKGQLVKWEALKPGMRVAVGAASDPNVAERIDADDPPTDGKK